MSHKNRTILLRMGYLKLRSQRWRRFLFGFWWPQHYVPASERLECNKVQSKRSLEERRPGSQGDVINCQVVEVTKMMTGTEPKGRRRMRP